MVEEDGRNRLIFTVVCLSFLKPFLFFPDVCSLLLIIFKRVVELKLEPWSYLLSLLLTALYMMRKNFQIMFLKFLMCLIIKCFGLTFLVTCKMVIPLELTFKATQAS